MFEIDFHPDSPANLGKIVPDVLDASDEVHQRFPGVVTDHARLRAVSRLPPADVSVERSQRFHVGEHFVAWLSENVVVERELPVPGIAHEGEFEEFLEDLGGEDLLQICGRGVFRRLLVDQKTPRSREPGRPIARSP